MMSPAELQELGEDIKANGLRHHIIFWSEKGECPIHDPKSLKRAVLLDGRNRLDAMELAGVEIKFDETLRHTVHQGDPYDYVISANLHRRHLTTAQKSELIEKLLKADPTKSDRAVAEVVKVDHKTVGAKRAALKAGGEIPHVDAERVGTDGKTYKQSAKPAAVDEGAVKAAAGKVADRTEFTMSPAAEFNLAGAALKEPPIERRVHALLHIVEDLTKLANGDKRRLAAVAKLDRALDAIATAFLGPQL
jgi:hypothetical protein